METVNTKAKRNAGYYAGDITKTFALCGDRRLVGAASHRLTRFSTKLQHAIDRRQPLSDVIDIENKSASATLSDEWRQHMFSRSPLQVVSGG